MWSSPAPFHLDLWYFRHRTNEYFFNYLYAIYSEKLINQPTCSSAPQVTQINKLDQITEKVTWAHTFHWRLWWSLTEVLIRIALLRRKMLSETKNRTLKCLNVTSRLCGQWKMLQCWRWTGHLPSFCVPTPGGLKLKSPHPLEFAIQG